MKCLTVGFLVLGLSSSAFANCSGTLKDSDGKIIRINQIDTMEEDFKDKSDYWGLDYDVYILDVDLINGGYARFEFKTAEDRQKLEDKITPCMGKNTASKDKEKDSGGIGVILPGGLIVY